MQLKKNWFPLLILFIVSLLFSADLFFHLGRPVTFDGPTHITTMAQFATGLVQRNFPVVWADGFGNYGMPIPLIAQQTTSYLGAVFFILVQNIVLAYNLVILCGGILTAFFTYYCLKTWFDQDSALVGTLLLLFAPYRIMNVFVRGDVPEYFVTVFVPILVLGFFHTIIKSKWWGLLFIFFGCSGMLLTHPIMAVPLSLLLGSAWLFFAFPIQRKWRVLLASVVAAGFGLLFTAYYLLPLFGEIKYFYYGAGVKHLVDNQYLSSANLLQPNWFYFLGNDISPRAQFFHLGALESIIFLSSIVICIVLLMKKKTKQFLPLFVATGLGGVYLFLMLPQSQFLYQHVLLLNNIQHPWRMLTGFIFIPPFLLAFLISKFVSKDLHKKVIVVLVLLYIAIFRFPQLYGKNYIFYPESNYFYTLTNLHGESLNTVWTGNTRSYPVKTQKPEVIEGSGSIVQSTVRNGHREYVIHAKGDIRMADYTFYFPGWKLFIDNTPTFIEFQDPNYRGVITYKVPAGTHLVQLDFTDTLVRKVGKGVTLVSVLLFAIWMFVERKYGLLVKKVIST